MSLTKKANNINCESDNLNVRVSDFAEDFVG